MKIKKQVEVVAAVIEADGRILCVQRGDHKYAYIAGKWEFPGGKLEPGESGPQALAREIREELHMDIRVGDKLLTVDHEYPDFALRMHAYRCCGEADALRLTEHVAFAWAVPTQLPKFDWAAADWPIVEVLLERFS